MKNMYKYIVQYSLLLYRLSNTGFSALYYISFSSFDMRARKVHFADANLIITMSGKYQVQMCTSS